MVSLVSWRPSRPFHSSRSAKWADGHQGHLMLGRLFKLNLKSWWAPLVSGILVLDSDETQSHTCAVDAQTSVTMILIQNCMSSKLKDNITYNASLAKEHSKVPKKSVRTFCSALMTSFRRMRQNSVRQTGDCVVIICGYFWGMGEEGKVTWPSLVCLSGSVDLFIRRLVNLFVSSSAFCEAIEYVHDSLFRSSSD